MTIRPYSELAGNLQGEAFSGPDHYELNVEFIADNGYGLYFATVERAKPRHYDSKNHGVIVEWARLYVELRRQYPDNQWMFVWDGVSERVDTLIRAYHAPGVALSVYGPGSLPSYTYDVVHAFKLAIEA